MSLQDIYKNAGVVMKPAAMKDGKLYSQQPHSGAGDFNFSRADGVQTRINKHGLIETVADNEPRLSYDIVDGKVSDCPHLLLEPSRTNLFTNSEDFTQSNWSKVNSTLSSNQTISPDGSLTADLLTATSDTGGIFEFNEWTTTQRTATFFVKKNTAQFVEILNASASGNIVKYNLDSGTIDTESGSMTGTVVNYGNGWFRLSATHTHTSTGTFGLRLLTSDESVYIWGAQIEQGSYATSYIPTSGSTEQRQADVCNGSGNSETFNDSEGVLFAELEALVDNDVSNRYISIANSAGTNFVTIQYRTSGSNFRVYQNGVGSSNIVYVANIDLTDSLKVAVKYGTSPSDYAVYINGINRTLNLGFVAGTMSGLSELKFLYGSGGAPWYGKAKELTVINEALTDEQLQLLTTP